MTTVDHTQQQLQQDPISLTYTPTGRTRAHTYGHCYTSRTDPREARSQGVLVAERSATEFIEIHAHSFVIGPAVIKHTHCTHQPHPCTVLTAAHHIHARPPDTVPARLAYQRPLVNTYRTFDLCRHQRARHRLGPGELLRSHAAGPARSSRFWTRPQ